MRIKTSSRELMWRKSLIWPQAHGGVVVIQGQSHTDYVKLWSCIPSRYAKRIQALRSIKIQR